MRNRGIWGLLAIAVIAIVLWLSTRGAQPDPVSAPSRADVTAPSSAELRMPETVAASPEAVASADTRPTPNLELPPSLAGTEIDGSVEFDASGQLRPTQSLRRLFDQVLTLVGERSIDDIRALLAQRLDSMTDADGKRQVLAAFERYLRYLQAQADAAPAFLALDLPARLVALKDLRRQQLGSEMADAFFADEEAYQEFTLAQRELGETPNLTDNERAARERELIADLPESARTPLLEQRATDAALADGDAIEERTSDPRERERLRSERFGADAAARMQALDQERALWQQRITAYQAERARINAMRIHSGARQTMLDEYLAREFDEAEQRRIRSLEGIGEL
jgi:lipase chaperone LimK